MFVCLAHRRIGGIHIAFNPLLSRRNLRINDNLIPGDVADFYAELVRWQFLDTLNPLLGSSLLDRILIGIGLKSSTAIHPLAGQVDDPGRKFWTSNVIRNSPSLAAVRLPP